MEKKGERIEAELVLLEDIIQHIQSFLTGKEACQTSFLSKSWYNAWLTRPSLDFDPRDFQSVDSFWEFVKKTVQKYEKSNLNIETLKLWIPDNDNSVLVKELIIKGLKMGATDLDFKINPPNIAFDLPDEVFGCENLNRVSVSGCVISNDNGIGWSRLKSLRLDSVLLKGGVIWDIISRCPLIEELSLSKCQFSTFRSDFSVMSGNALQFGKRFVRPSWAPYQFRKLKCLVLCEVKVDPNLFELSHKFPCLEDLVLDDCETRDSLKVSSSTLECISITWKRKQKLTAIFDVPKIRKFTFSGVIVPVFLFTATNIWGKFDVCIRCDSVPWASWFCTLNTLLTTMTFSRVYLSLGFLDNFMPLKLFPEWLGNIALPKSVVVEDITVVDPPPPDVIPVIFNVLFQCIHPVFVTQYLAPKSSASWNKNHGFVVFVFERLLHMQRVRLNCQCDLEQVNVEFYDEALSVWRPIITSEEGRLGCDYDDKRIRLHLKWTC